MRRPRWHRDLMKRTDLRFSAHIIHGGNCMEWGGYFQSAGYGHLVIQGRRWLAHRFAYQLHAGSIAPELLVRHHCDNRRCVTPAHLEQGTHTDNMLDSIVRGRRWRKLDDDGVRRARAMVGEGMPQNVVARQLGIAEPTLSQILSGKRRARLMPAIEQGDEQEREPGQLDAVAQ